MVVELSFLLPSLVVLREDVCRWADLEFFAVPPPLPLDIPPHVRFAAQTPGPGEVVDLLVRVHVLELRWPDQGGPQAIPGGGAIPLGHDMEPCSLESIDDAIVGVSDRNPEGQKLMGF